jgi:hypothetical protein
MKMPGRYKRRNMTLVEVIVIVFICLFVTAVVIPAGNKSSSIAFRTVCADNLSGLGKAMLIYANDYDDEFPRAGGRSTVWSSQIPNWMAENRYEAYGIDGRGEGGEATISSSLYLLVKYAEVAPKSFICPGDEGTTEFRLADYEVAGKDLNELWDFGPEPYNHCSYAYHMPYGLHALNVSREPGLAVLADRNPWMDSPAGAAKDFRLFNPEGPREAVKAGNAIAHEEEGQNVLFLDSHVSFETSSFCGINDDNIYTFWDGGDIRVGGTPTLGISESQDIWDSLLVHDPAPPRQVIVTKQPEEVNSVDLERTSVVATLDSPIPEHHNVIWCSAFQIAWDGLEENIIGEPIQVLGAEELAARLNEAEVPETDIEEESFYAAAGFVGDGILGQIQEEMANRFSSETSPVFDESYDTMLDAAVLYSYLNVNSEFDYPFYVNDNAFTFEDSNGVYTDVTSFCTYLDEWNSDAELVHEQVDVLYYKRGGLSLGEAEFAIDLCKNSGPYQIVLARVPQCGTLGETVAFVEEKIAEFKNYPEYEELHVFRPPDLILGDSLRVPDILYKLTHNFAELEDKLLANPQWQDYSIVEARQVVNFASGRIGVVLTSQAASGVVRPILPRNFHFDKPFLVYVKKRQEEANPFFVMWVDNAELMKEFSAENDE